MNKIVIISCSGGYYNKIQSLLLKLTSWRLGFLMVDILMVYLFEDIAMIPSPKQFLSNLLGVAKASVVNYPIGNESSIFVSEITKISTLPLISSERTSNLFRIEFIFK